MRVRNAGCTSGCVLWWEASDYSMLSWQRSVTSPVCRWTGTGTDPDPLRPAPVQNQYQDRCVLYSVWLQSNSQAVNHYISKPQNMFVLHFIIW